MRTTALDLPEMERTGLLLWLSLEVGNFSPLATVTEVVELAAVEVESERYAAALHWMVSFAANGTTNGDAVEALVVSAPAAETMEPRSFSAARAGEARSSRDKRAARMVHPPLVYSR
jgi:hypothetical protein